MSRDSASTLSSVPLWIILLSLTAFLTACNRHGREIALLTPTTGVFSWNGIDAGAVPEAKTCGLRVHYDGGPREDDLRLQLELLAEFVRRGYAGIVIQPVQAQALRSPIERASSAGLPIVVAGIDLGIRNPNLAYVLNDEAAGGKLAADEIGGVLHGKGTVAIMGLDLSNPSSLARERAIEQELTQHFRNIVVIPGRNGSSNLFEEQQTAEDLLDTSHHVDAIIALSASATRGAYYAAKVRDISHRIHIIGFDQDLLSPLVTGEIDGIVAVRTHDVGETAARLICDRLNGRQWTAEAKIIPPLLITRANGGSDEVQRQLEYDRWKWDDEN